MLAPNFHHHNPESNTVGWHNDGCHSWGVRLDSSLDKGASGLLPPPPPKKTSDQVLAPSRFQSKARGTPMQKTGEVRFVQC